MTNILIAGLGGVGGYFGGLLARRFYQDETVKVNFLARGEHLDAIRHKGLQIIKGRDSVIVSPAAISDKAEDLGPQDYIIVCTKNYDLESVVRQLAPCIKSDTVILPLQNGVDSRERIEKLTGGNLVCNGCVYIVSRLLRPGVIENAGNVEALYFGIEGITDERLIYLEYLLKQADIHADLPVNILTVIWEKFVFLAPIATATAYYDNPVGAILSDKKTKNVLAELVAEVISLARLKNIQLNAGIVDRTMDKVQSLPADATTSMHHDFKAGKLANELESLTGYIVREARTAGLSVPVFEQLYLELKAR